MDGKEVYENPGVKEKIAYIPDDLFYFMQADIMEMKRFYAGIITEGCDSLAFIVN